MFNFLKKLNHKDWSFIVTLLIILSIAGFNLAIKMEVWDECRISNSFWYCYKLIGR